MRAITCDFRHRADVCEDTATRFNDRIFVILAQVIVCRKPELDVVILFYDLDESFGPLYVIQIGIGGGDVQILQNPQAAGENRGVAEEERREHLCHPRRPVSLGSLGRRDAPEQQGLCPHPQVARPERQAPLVVLVGRIGRRRRLVDRRHRHDQCRGTRNLHGCGRDLFRQTGKLLQAPDKCIFLFPQTAHGLELVDRHVQPVTAAVLQQQVVVVAAAGVERADVGVADLVARIARTLEEHDIDALLIIGGWSGYSAAEALAAERGAARVQDSAGQ